MLAVLILLVTSTNTPGNIAAGTDQLINFCVQNIPIQTVSHSRRTSSSCLRVDRPPFCLPWATDTHVKPWLLNLNMWHVIPSQRLSGVGCPQFHVLLWEYKPLKDGASAHLCPVHHSSWHTVAECFWKCGLRPDVTSHFRALVKNVSWGPVLGLELEFFQCSCQMLKILSFELSGKWPDDSFAFVFSCPFWKLEHEIFML